MLNKTFCVHFLCTQKVFFYVIGKCPDVVRNQGKSADRLRNLFCKREDENFKFSYIMRKEWYWYERNLSAWER